VASARRCGDHGPKTHREDRGPTLEVHIYKAVLSRRLNYRIINALTGHIGFTVPDYSLVFKPCLKALKIT
jgi:hypothetical protein